MRDSAQVQDIRKVYLDVFLEPTRNWQRVGKFEGVGFSSPEWTLPRVNRSDPDIFGMKLDVFHLVANKVASDISNRGGFLPVAKPLRIE